MAKSVLDRFKSSKSFKETFGCDFEMNQGHITEFENFDQQVGFTHDRAASLVKFMIQDHKNWVSLWQKIKQLGSGHLTTQIILYGEEEGTKRYKSMNINKTKKFDHSSEAQTKKAIKAAEVRRGRKDCNPRCVEYWIERKGCSLDEAKQQVSLIQATNTKENYIKKYGAEQGIDKFEKRKKDWVKMMSDPEITKKRSLGLWRYKERYGEVLGKQKYLEMRRERNRNNNRVTAKSASKQSMNSFKEIITLLNEYKIHYYVGYGDNKEWFIEDNGSFYFYDLTIPSLGIIIEFHGEVFHPSPYWDEVKWNNWRQLYTGKTADEVYERDQMKKSVAEKNNWCVFEMFSDNQELIENTSNTVCGLIIESRS